MWAPSHGVVWPAAIVPMRHWDPMSHADFRYDPYVPGRPLRWCWMSCNYCGMGSWISLVFGGETSKETNECTGSVCSVQASFISWCCLEVLPWYKVFSCSAGSCTYIVSQQSILFPYGVKRLPIQRAELGAEPSPGFLVLFCNHTRDRLSVICSLGHTHQSCVSLCCSKRAHGKVSMI